MMKKNKGESVFKLAVFVPESHLDAVKQAMFDAGAGKIGDYDSCCWQTQGTGQFRPLPGSDPFIGKSGGDVELVAEYKVEMVCEKQLLKKVIAALRQAHPYEEPAFDVIELVDFD